MSLAQYGGVGVLVVQVQIYCYGLYKKPADSKVAALVRLLQSAAMTE